MTETWLDKHTCDIYQLDGYKFVANNRVSGKKGGGVGIYINNDVIFTVCNEFTKSNNVIECIFVKITFMNNDNNESVLIGCVYRPPGSVISEFIKELTVILNMLECSKCTTQVLCGDYNLNLINCSAHKDTDNFLNLLYAYAYVPYITNPTQITNHSATLIDNFFVKSMSKNIESAIVYNGISDHFPILLKVSHNSYCNPTPKYSNMRVYDKDSIKKFIGSLEQINWHETVFIDENSINLEAHYNNFIKFL